MPHALQQFSVEVYAKASLILAALTLFATENLVHYPVALMSLLGLGQMILRPKDCLAGPARALAILFCLIWIPMLFASAGAYEIDRAAKTSILYLHFLPAAYFVYYACRQTAVFNLVSAGTAILLIFVGFDAFVQLIWRVDLFGYPYDDGILRGVFHPKQRLGLFLAVFAPLYVDAIVRWCRQFPRLWLILVPIVIVILMSLKRSAWVMLFIGMAAYLVLFLQHRQLRLHNLRLIPIVVVVATAIMTVVLNPTLQDRLYISSGIISGDPAITEEATAHRYSLWRTGYAMFADNWLNGVGPRGYRYAYANYAAEDDFWLDRNGAGQTHPHLLLLEVAAETGVLGIVGLMFFYAQLGREFFARRAHEIPVWLLCAAVAWFPLNVHLAFYGSYWSTLIWLLIPIGLAGGAVEKTDRIETDSS